MVAAFITFMKIITFLLLLFSITLCVCFPAFAQDNRWVFIADDADDTSFFIDITSRKIIGDRVRTWHKNIYKDGSYRINLAEWNCDEEKYFMLDSTVYSKSGSYIRKDKGTEWYFVVPNSVNEIIYKFACFGLPENFSIDTLSAGKTVVEVTVNKANLRSAPSRNSQIIREASIGERFPLVSNELVSYFWYQITIPGTNETAWIHRSTVKLVKLIPIPSQSNTRRQKAKQ